MIRLAGSSRLSFVFPAQLKTAYAYYRDIRRTLAYQRNCPGLYRPLVRRLSILERAGGCTLTVLVNSFVADPGEVKYRMKRFSLFVVVSVLLLSQSACGLFQIRNRPQVTEAAGAQDTRQPATPAATFTPLPPMPVQPGAAAPTSTTPHLSFSTRPQSHSSCWKTRQVS